MFNDMSKMEVLLGALSGEKLGDIIEQQEKREQRNVTNKSRLPIKYNNYNKTSEEEYKQLLNRMGITIIDEHDDLFYNVELPEGWKTEYTDHFMWNNLLDEKDRIRGTFFYKGAFYDRDAFMNFNRRFSIHGEVADYNEEKFKRQPEYIQDGYEYVWEKTKENTSMRRRWTYYDDEVFYEKDGEIMKEVKKPKYIKNPDYVPLTGYEKYSQPFHFEVHDHDGILIFKSDIVKTDFEYSQGRHREFFNHRDEVTERAKTQCVKWLEENYPEWENVLSYWD